ncbi:PREDICTED: protein transport protein Sec31A [Propithecus coquereli]|uniref:protein transport protein Sec31A n=1 Tax=Propithecus coquereli TaxID=379532 RepID=UPI00063FB50B|nr:PREDICTED: protein transport protein Sec31A [Propithecus coquereli]
MKLKEIDRTAMQAWSPAQNHPIYLATGTSAQQLDATFSTNASLEIFELDLSDPSLDMKSCATFSSSHRYHKLIWGPYKMDSKGDVSGVLIAGGENGNIILYDPSKIIAGDKEVVIAQNDKHTGPVRALDVNIFQMHCSGLAWHPDVATQMVLASEDDRLPVIQMWDLRFASSPLRVLENHARGILAIAWSMADPELLLSCGKDAKILCSNPNTGEVLYELPTNTQWCFDIQWCPRNPAVLSAASFDGRISVYSIMGGSTDGLRQKQVDKLSSSFGNLDPFGTGQPLPPLQIPQQTAQHSMVLPLKKPPKWIRRPVGASFSFGGKLVTFESVRVPSQQGAEQQQQQLVFISQVVTEKEFLSRSDQLQQVVRSQGYVAYCQKKIDASQIEFEKNVWSFLKVNFEDDSRGKYLELLGYRKEDLGKKIALALNKVDGADVRIKEEKQESEFLPSAGGTFNISISGDIDGLITQALLTGNFESAVDLCLHDNRMADAIILAIAGGQELLAQTQKKYFAKSQSKITRLITAVVMKNWKEIVESCDLKNWREALAAVLTYAKPDEFSALCVTTSDLSDLSVIQNVLLRKHGVLTGENPPPPGFLMHGNINPNAAAQRPTSPGHVHTQGPPYPQPQPCQPAQQYSFGTGGSAMYRPQQPVAPPASNAYPNTPYAPSAASYSGQSQLYAAQHQASSPNSSPAPAFPPPPSSGASFQHGGPGAPPSSSAYALPPGTTGTLPAASELPASQRTGLRLKGIWFGSLLYFFTNRWVDGGLLFVVANCILYGSMPENFMPPVPITSPIMNPLGDPQSQMLQQQPSAPVPLSGQASFPQPHLPGGQPFHGLQQPLSQAGLPPAFSKPSIEGAPGAPIGNTIQVTVNLRKWNGEMALFPYISFNMLTFMIAPLLINEHLNLQTKRKLDDASKRLEFLYDKLREQTLSPTITSGLHSIARSIETRNYSEGLTIHTHIVSTSNFSETSAFMPVLKVVLTQANKLGV